MEIGLPRGEDGNVLHATVKRRAVDVDGRPIGRPSNNPITDSRLYDVEFLDGTMETISANIIAENLLSQVDSEGHRQLMLDEIIDHRKCDNAISKADAFVGVSKLQEAVKCVCNGKMVVHSGLR